MIYLNHAATSFPKPEKVVQAVTEALQCPPAGQYRSVFDSRGREGDVTSCLRKRMGEILGVLNPERIFFTSGATQSLNMMIQGLGLSQSLVLVSEAEHNSVLRPLYNGGAAEVRVIPCDPAGHVRQEALRDMLASGPAAVFINHCSNVTGAIQDMKEISREVHEAGGILVADLSQSAGVIPLHLEEDQVDIGVFTGHKGLRGPQGTGGFYIREGLHVRPLFYGGTGKDSERLRYDDDWEGYEVGTQNGPGLAGLLAGVESVLSEGIDVIYARENQKITSLYQKMKQIPGIHLYAPDPPEGPLFSFSLQSLTPQDTAYILYHGYGIVTRVGLHCAPLLARAIHCPKQGSVRISIGTTTTEAELDTFLKALQEIAAEGGK